MAELASNINLFNGSGNFNRWKQEVIDLLEAKGVAHAVSKDLRVGDAKALSPEDQKANGLAKVIIRACLAPSIQQLAYDRTAYEIWKELHDIYGVANTAMVVNKLLQLIDLKMPSGESDAIAHTNAFKFLTREMPINNLSQKQLETLIYIASLNERFEQVVTKYGNLDPTTYTSEQVYDDAQKLSMLLTAKDKREASLMGAAVNNISSDAAEAT
ncbi:hypothetical protein LPJ61_007085, partial [Coemansia biformis]